ncbi:ABC transporter [Desulfococcus multivorans]|jgi:ubiquinone biosynthesis protein|uniref:ABC-1 domain-containing protein n=2 Tax=Desulfococcaceae TaxID=2931039 RepID=S7TH73_DESML|nr:UbiB3: predicted ubiquinone biosynthesis protein [Desulfococcus multivorans]AQV02113.1 ABC transporter [Desulfococcus multivorans]EPR35960.1 ABC-1 domain-containing protein [Desulfococcus multivorans DSM 2059]SJZ35906.1 2-octaprenylphenol hydroxylase [Desulfococcus multivorans DSM 2059]
MLSIRKIGVFGRTYRHLNRYRHILGILIKYGFGDLIERLNIDQYIETGLQMLSSSKRSTVPGHHKLTRAERVRMAVEELGPTYIKLGQLLSTRSDFLPPHYIDELSKLQDEVPPFPFAEVRTVFESEFHRPPEELFATFAPEPFASASIGQVHKAVTRNGDIVAVKVQRPGIQQTIEVDVEIMLHLATLMERNIEEAAFHRPVKIVEEFARSIEKEIDYTIEAGHIERFARQFLSVDALYVPKVFREMTTERILTMEFVKGIKISRTSALEAAGLDKRRVVDLGADLLLRQVFDYGFFHADPHPGNILVLPGHVICLLDFGMMGSLDRYTKKAFVDLIYGAARRDEFRTAQVLLRLTSWETEPDVRLLERDVADMMGQYLYRPLKDIKVNKLLQDLLALTSRHHLRIPPDLFLMLKAFSSVEGIARLLNPEFDMVARAVPFLKREKMARFRPERIAEEILSVSGDLAAFFQQFPREALEVVRLMKRQRLTVRFEHHGLENLIETHDRISNKLSFAIITAALIIGSAIIVIAKIPPLFFGISLIGIIVFIAAAVLGLWLIFAIMRKKRI